MNIKFEFKTKDYVLLGILAAMYLVLYMVIGAILATLSMPISYITTVGVYGIFGGIIITFLMFKIPKMWILTLLNIFLILLYTLLGMVYLPMVIGMLSGGILGDLLANSSAYKSKFKNALAYAFMNSGMTASMIIPILISTRYYASQVEMAGATPDMVQSAIYASIGWVGVLTLSITFFGSFAGIYLGYSVLTKHFKKQER